MLNKKCMKWAVKSFPTCVISSKKIHICGQFGFIWFQTKWYIISLDVFKKTSKIIKKLAGGAGS